MNSAPYIAWCTSLRRRLRQWVSLPVSERCLLLEAVFWLAWARLALRLVPFRRLAPRLGQPQAESPHSLPPEAVQQARLIARLVGIAGRHLPWTCTCLVQALAGMQMLRRRGQSCTLYLGAAKDQAQQFCAHAWLRSGEVLVTGGREHQDFVVVGSFRHMVRPETVEDRR
jgi:hypothetical protein